MSASEQAPVRRAAMDLLARREHSRRELIDKLQRRGAKWSSVDPRMIEEVVAQLADEGLQSDARFAESYIRGRAGRGYGPRRIRLELIQRGISRGLADEALGQTEVDWPALMRDAVARRFGDGAPVDARERFRRLRYLQDRGFDVTGEAGHLVD